MVPSISLGEKRTGRNSGGDTPHQGSETAMQLLFTIALADATPLHNGAAFFPEGTTRGFEARSHTTQPKSMAGILLHGASKFASARTLESCSLLHSVEGKPEK